MSAIPLALHLQREGKPLTLNVKLEHRAERITSSRPTTSMTRRRIYVLGGLIFQELSRQYLKEWGANWQKDAPQDFVYLDQVSSRNFSRKANDASVILSQVLPGEQHDRLRRLQLPGGEEGERERSSFVKRPGRGGEDAGQRLPRHRDRGRPEAARARRRRGRGRSGRACRKITACPALQRLP